MDNMTDLFSIEHFWINPLSKHFSQIRVSDLVLVNENGEVQPGGAQYPINGPAFAIHSEIHKARPDLNAACHAHSVYGKAFSCFGECVVFDYMTITCPSELRLKNTQELTIFNSCRPCH